MTRTPSTVSEPLVLLSLYPRARRSGTRTVSLPGHLPSEISRKFLGDSMTIAPFSTVTIGQRAMSSSLQR